ncbi:MAG TPA: hypothetical protein PKM27_01365 [Saprospiraceae bacterium]|nr:hypothetical protein [Saprospiraceae bacterium]HNT19194.1 hypothetical protein [Saprospiraceae bacterium]
MNLTGIFKNYVQFKINGPGGIWPSGLLVTLTGILKEVKTERLKFGLRQSMHFRVHKIYCDYCCRQLEKAGILYEADSDAYPNVMSSYPAAGIFSPASWLTEGVYRDILDELQFRPRLKINICDIHQSFTPFFTGNVNWISSAIPHYWHLYIRFPGTNSVYAWKELFYTNELMRFSRQLDSRMSDFRPVNEVQCKVAGEQLQLVMKSRGGTTIPKEAEPDFPPFTLSYYEGFNAFQDHYWLGIYRRDEFFDVGFLHELGLLSQETRIGQICSTAWKSLIIKGIEDKDRPKWIRLLNRYQINLRHALNELNFQVEDDSPSGLALKHFLVKRFNDADIRTTGICFGIKTRSKAEIFSSILIRKKYLFHLLGLDFIPVYDIFAAKDFNPNERSEYLIGKSLFRYLVPDQLIACIRSYYRFRLEDPLWQEKLIPGAGVDSSDAGQPEYFFQCRQCLSLAEFIPPEVLPWGYRCSVCEAPPGEFELKKKRELYFPDTGIQV